ncbi:hypothetical protein [Streptomyces sp. NPDC005148]
MDAQTLQIRFTLRPDSGDPYERDEATQDLESAIQRLAADHPGLVVNGGPDPDQQRSAGAILIDVLPPIISGLFTLVSAYVAHHQPSVTVKVRVTTATGQLVYQGATDEIPETITTQYGSGTPAEAAAEPPSNIREL